MQIYLALQDEKRGPFSLFQVTEMIGRGEAGPATLAWHRGCEDWAPLGDMEAFADVFRQLEEKAEEAEWKAERAPAPVPKFPGEDARRYLPSGTVRPWVRFWARKLDQAFLFLGSLALLWGLQTAGVPGVSISAFYESWAWFLYPAWVFAEAWFLSRWGATPGKMLLKVRVEGHDGARLHFGTALRRSLSVFVMGLGCMLPVLSLFTQGVSYALLRRTGLTHWDRGLDTRVRHGKAGWREALLGIGIVYGAMVLLQQPMEEAVEPLLREMERVFGELRPPDGGPGGNWRGA